jgi:hypothetical protein
MAHVTAFFTERFSAHAAIEQLVQTGFPRDDISIIMSESTLGREFAPPSVPPISGNGASSPPSSRSSGVLGAIVSDLVGVGSGAGLLAAGPLLATLVKTGDAGTLYAALVGAGVPEVEARFVSERIRVGGILVGVMAAQKDRAELANQVLRLSGGESLKPS